jgi:two-component system sensor histidine kinase DesK
MHFARLDAAVLPGSGGMANSGEHDLVGSRRLGEMRALAPWSVGTPGAVRPNRLARAGARLLALGGLDGPGAGWANGLAVTVLSLVLVARLANVLAAGADGQVPFTVALFVVPLLCAVPRTRAVLMRHRWLVLAVQAVLTWVPFAVFGSSWQLGIGGWLAGLVLLLIPGWVGWLAAGGLLATEVLVRAVLTGLPVSPPWYAVVSVAGYYLNDALEFFALVRLAQIVGEIAEARDRAAGLAVAGERLAAARSLQEAVGERLADIAAKATAAQHALGSDAAQARAQITAAGITARDAVAQARQVAARHRDRPGAKAAAPSAGGAVIGARLAWAVLVVVVLSFAVDDIASIAWFQYSGWLTALTTGVAVLATALQLYHSAAARQGRKPRAWPLTLGLLAVLAYAFAFPFIGVYTGSAGLLLAASVLLLVPGRWRWAVFGAVVASYSVLYAVVLPSAANAGNQLAANIVYLAALTAGVGLMLYGLAWLAGLAVQLEALNGELAQMALVQERLRIARDVHDLLGLGLSAIALKTDLIARLIGRDDARAAAEIAEMNRICASARAEIRLVTREGQRLSLAAELAAARQILSSAGVEVRADLVAGPLPATADDVLAPVLREAVTNILRHSAATTCTIEATASGGLLRLQVTNDGAAAPPAASAHDSAGRGLANLQARVQAAGGSLTSDYADGQFRLTAALPQPRAAGADHFSDRVPLRAMHTAQRS